MRSAGTQTPRSARAHAPQVVAACPVACPQNISERQHEIAHVHYWVSGIITPWHAPVPCHFTGIWIYLGCYRDLARLAFHLRMASDFVLRF